MNDTATTTDHDTIRRWAEDRGVTPPASKAPARAYRAHRVLGTREERLEPSRLGRKSSGCSTRTNLACVYQEKTADGSTSRLNKLVDRDGPDRGLDGVSGGRCRSDTRFGRPSIPVRKRRPDPGGRR